MEPLEGKREKEGKISADVSAIVLVLPYYLFFFIGSGKEGGKKTQRGDKWGSNSTLF